jgi:hypothetical protein
LSCHNTCIPDAPKVAKLAKYIKVNPVDRVLGFLFSGQNFLVQIYGTQGAVTKAFPTNH